MIVSESRPPPELNLLVPPEGESSRRRHRWGHELPEYLLHDTKVLIPVRTLVVEFEECFRLD